MRIGEALSLELDDLDFQQNRIDIRKTKSGERRDSFFSDEAGEYLREWLNNRDRYLQEAVQKSTLHAKSVDDNHVFPFKMPVAYGLAKLAMFGNLVESC